MHIGQESDTDRLKAASWDLRSEEIRYEPTLSLVFLFLFPFPPLAPALVLSNFLSTARKCGQPTTRQRGSQELRHFLSDRWVVMTR
jgi:hypothetical protein